MTHQELEDLMPLLALEALNAEQERRARAHLETCDICRALLNEYQQIVDEMLAGSPAARPPQVLRPRLQALARAQRDRAPAAPVDTSGSRLQRLPDFWRQTLKLPRWTVVSALGVVMLLLLTNLWLFAQWQESLARDQTTRALMSILRSPGTVSVNLNPTASAPPTAQGQLILSRQSNAALLMVHQLTKLPPQQVYQVWLTRDGHKDSAGLFSVDEHGHAVVLLQAPQLLSVYREIGITIEPLGGSTQPTSPRLIGALLD